MAVDIGIQSTLRSSQATLTKILVNYCINIFLKQFPSETPVSTNIHGIWDPGHSSRHLCPQVETWLLLTLGRWATTADGILEILSWSDSSTCVFHLLYLIHSCQRKSSRLLIASLVLAIRHQWNDKWKPFCFLSTCHQQHVGDKQHVQPCHASCAMKSYHLTLSLNHISNMI